MTKPGRMEYEELARLLGEQAEAYRLLLSLSRGQKGALAEGGARAVMKIVARKQGVINRLEALDQELRPYTSRWRTVVNALPGPARATVEETVDEIARLIREVIASEREMEAVLAAAHEIAGRCRIVSSGLKATRAYGGAALAPAGRLVDGTS
jgi:hypothetical protein